MIAYRLAEDPLYHPVVIKDEQRFCKRILIVDDEADVTITLKAGIEAITIMMLTKELKYIPLIIL